MDELIDASLLVTFCPGSVIPPDPVTGRVWKYQCRKNLMMKFIELDCSINMFNGDNFYG